ncbi:dethiobiotin synthetase [Desulfocucumis palustris]|uniref:ATP-dependent dethiobiotin synthetase BioD n=1 Tax=Desulfocucumis palustris TaxID=1898651 RepID=A0A2L2XFF7_9FIRM|nr:dethiobiotin synthase [Desulfocucumis palustris]GBF34754.1 dethiobiotin synthetase [Desulfocucumis palustris]
MGSGIFITGTDTGVGKTVITAGLMTALLKAGIDAAAFKPVQSGAKRTGKGLVSPDAAFYLRAAGVSARESDYSLYCLEQPLSPHIAAELDGITIVKEPIIKRCREYLDRHRVLLVEGAGGICVPLNRSGFLMADLARELDFPLLVVARPSLGTINHTVLSIKYAQMTGLRVAGFIFNNLRQGAGLMEKDNAEMIELLTGVPLLGMVPHLPGLDVDGGIAGPLADTVGQYLQLTEIGGLFDECAGSTAGRMG